MATNLITVKSCCGSKALIAETDKAVRKLHVPSFQELGYMVAENFYNVGVFYAQKENLIATAAFGATKLSIRCSGENCQNLIDSFISDLEKVTHT